MGNFTLKRLQRDKHFSSTEERKFQKALKNTKTRGMLEDYLKERGKQRRGYSEKSFKKYLRKKGSYKMSKVGKKAITGYLNEYGKSSKESTKTMPIKQKATKPAPKTSPFFGSNQRNTDDSSSRYKAAARASSRVRQEFAGGIKTAASYGDRPSRVNMAPRNTAMRMPSSRSSIPNSGSIKK